MQQVFPSALLLRPQQCAAPRRRKAATQADFDALFADAAASQKAAPTRVPAKKQGNLTIPLYRKRTCITRRHVFCTPLLTISFDSTLGYPGEGPETFRVASSNMNGILAPSRLFKICRSACRLKTNVLFIQHTNLSAGDARIKDLKRTAKDAGFKLFLSSPAIGTDALGKGTAILIDKNFSALKVLSNQSILDGAACVVNVTIWDKAYKRISAYVPSLSTEREPMIDLLTPHITPSTILGGDFNCVTNIAMDTSRDAKSPYNNTGSDKINTSIEVNNLCDDVRTTLGVGFAHTHAQQVHFKDVNGQ